MPTITRDILATVAGKTDAEAAAQLSVPQYVPKRDRITLTTIGGAWGLARGAEFRAWLVAASSQQSQLGYIAATILDLLKGPGFDAFHADVPSTIAALVAAGGCTNEEANAALYDMSYPCGEPVTAEQVSAARAAVVRADTLAARRALVVSRYNAAITMLEGDTIPSEAELLAAMGAA